MILRLKGHSHFNILNAPLLETKTWLCPCYKVRLEPKNQTPRSARPLICQSSRRCSWAEVVTYHWVTGLLVYILIALKIWILTSIYISGLTSTTLQALSKLISNGDVADDIIGVIRSVISQFSIKNSDTDTIEVAVNVRWVL